MCQRRIVKRKYANIVFNTQNLLPSFFSLMFYIILAKTAQYIHIYRHIIKKWIPICVFYLPDSSTSRFIRNDEHSITASLFRWGNTILKQNLMLSFSADIIFIHSFTSLFDSHFVFETRLRPIVPPADDAKRAALRACALSIAVTGAKLPLSALATPRGQLRKL